MITSRATGFPMTPLAITKKNLPSYLKTAVDITVKTLVDLRLSIQIYLSRLGARPYVRLHFDITVYVTQKHFQQGTTSTFMHLLNDLLSWPATAATVCSCPVQNTTTNTRAQTNGALLVDELLPIDDTEALEKGQRVERVGVSDLHIPRHLLDQAHEALQLRSYVIWDWRQRHKTVAHKHKRKAFKTYFWAPPPQHHYCS